MYNIVIREPTTIFDGVNLLKYTRAPYTVPVAATNLSHPTSISGSSIADSGETISKLCIFTAPTNLANADFFTIFDNQTILVKNDTNVPRKCIVNFQYTFDTTFANTVDPNSYNEMALIINDTLIVRPNGAQAVLISATTGSVSQDFCAEFIIAPNVTTKMSIHSNQIAQKTDRTISGFFLAANGEPIQSYKLSSPGNIHATPNTIFSTIKNLCVLTQ